MSPGPVAEGSWAEFQGLLSGTPAELAPDPRIDRAFQLMRGPPEEKPADDGKINTNEEKTRP